MPKKFVMNYRHARSKLARGQVKQVQRIIEKNKRLKNTYVPISDVLATQVNTGFGTTGAWVREITDVPSGVDSTTRTEDQILLKSYNIKLGSVNVQGTTGDYGTSFHSFAPFRVIIARSKVGPKTDIVDITGNSILDFNAQPDPDLYQVYTDEIHNMYGNSSIDEPTQMYSSTGANGYLLHMYKSFKNKKVPHMIVGYDGTSGNNLAVSNGILMKVIGDPASYINSDKTFLHGFKGWAHLKYFDKE